MSLRHERSVRPRMSKFEFELKRTTMVHKRKYLVWKPRPREVRGKKPAEEVKLEEKPAEEIKPAPVEERLPVEEERPPEEEERLPEEKPT